MGRHVARPIERVRKGRSREGHEGEGGRGNELSRREKKARDKELRTYVTIRGEARRDLEEVL